VVAVYTTHLKPESLCVPEELPEYRLLRNFRPGTVAGDADKKLITTMLETV